MTGVRERLAGGQVIVSDGAMGTLLMEAGLERGACPEEICLTNPEALSRIASRYAEAGATMVHTNTFGASPLKLTEYRLGDQAESINREAVRAARRGVGADVLVSGSVGPSGRILEPYGDLTEAVLEDSFRRQVGALVEADVDAITVETMIDLREAVLAVRAVRALSADVPVFATMTFQSTPGGFRTVMGTSVDQAVGELTDAGADAVGSNCGNGIEDMVDVAEAFGAVTDYPLLIQANAGAPELQRGVVRYPESPEDFAAAVPALLAAGVSAIGGCCGTDPAHIRAIRWAVDQHDRTSQPS